MRKLVILAFLFQSFSNTYACDICGCSAGNYFIGPFPQFHKHFFGFRYTYRKYNSMVAGDASQFSHDFYQTMEIWSGWNLGKKWQLMAFVPYNINRQHSDEGTVKNNGLGDITLLMNYKLLDKRSKDNNGISQQLWLGGGLKLPTGKFAASPDEIIPQANNQAGTGSVDYLFNGMYALHMGDWGINTTANYKINNAAHGFRFGNRFSSSAFVFRSFSGLKTTFIPNAGLLFEDLQSNKLNNAKVQSTGGHALLIAGGLDVNFKKISVGFNVQAPVSQNFSGGQTTAKGRGMLHINLIF
jgi:hypothetical protein